MFILTDLAIRWYIFSSDTGYSFGLIFIFLATFLICFLFIAAFTFLCFITASFLIFSFSFWSASFFAFSCSILFIILKFSSEVIQKLWNIFFLIVCFLMNVGTCIKSSKEKLLPILKNLFRLFTKIQVYFFSLLFLSSLVFFTLTTLALPPLTIPATSIFLTSGLKSFKGMFNKFFFPLPTVSLDSFCVSFFGCFFGGSDDPPIIANILSCIRDLFGISVASSFLRGDRRRFTGFWIR